MVLGGRGGLSLYAGSAFPGGGGRGRERNFCRNVTPSLDHVHSHHPSSFKDMTIGVFEKAKPVGCEKEEATSHKLHVYVT